MTDTSDFRQKANQAFDSFVDQSRRSLEQGQSATLSEKRMEKRSAEIIQPMDTGSIQSALRPLFGKGPVSAESIGGHPDFQHLENTNRIEYSPITTLFVDMEGSTKLGLLHDPKDAFIFKDAIIRSAIGIVEAFDGHVHRIMGDAVMGFFGRRDDPTEAGVVDGLNCASTLMAFFDTIVQPKLQDAGYDDSRGIRIGLDYGSEEEVLWSSYGIEDTSEVTATSFHVDIAAKLQENAGRNEVLIGQSLKEHIDFPERHLLEIPTRIKNGEEETDRYVRPNYVQPDGGQVNYRKYNLVWTSYLGWTPLQVVNGIYESGPDPVNVNVDIHASKKGQYESKSYPASSRPLEKEKGLKFTFEPPEDISPPYTVWTKVRNHGKEAENADQCDREPKSYKVENWRDQRNFSHWETTRYRGLHYLDFELRKDGTTHYWTRYGVYIR